MPQRLALCSGAVLAGARSLARKAASQMWMNVPMPTGAVRARAATPWVAFTVAAHPATSCRVMAKRAKMWMNVDHTMVVVNTGV